MVTLIANEKVESIIKWGFQYYIESVHSIQVLASKKHTHFCNMYFAITTIISLLVFETFAVPHCKIDEATQRICVRSDYLTYKPDDIPIIEVITVVRILNAVELNWKENTITLFIELMALWNDTRVFINET